MNSVSILNQFVDRARELYTLPTVALEVLQLTQEDQVDVAALKACIEKDPALTAKLLRVVNSSLFGLSRQVADLHQTLALLGVKPLKLLVLGFSLPPQLFEGVEEQALARFWRRSLTKAVAAKEIYEATGPAGGPGSSDEAFLAGLLQGIGMLALIQDLGESYAEFLDHVFAEHADLLSMETASLGFDHQILSARLLRAWRMPESFVAAIGPRGSVESVLALAANEQRMAKALHLADLLNSVLIDQRPTAFSELEEAIERYTSPSKVEMEAIVGRLDEKVTGLASVLSLSLESGLAYTDILAQAHAGMATTASDLMIESTVLQDVEHLQSEMQRFVGPANVSPSNAAPATIVEKEFTPDPGVIGRLTLGVSGARRDRKPLSLIILQIDRFEELILLRGVDGAERTVNVLESAIGVLAKNPVIHEGDGRFLIVASDCDRRDAVQLGRRTTDAVRDWSSQRGHVITLSCGIACVNLPPKNFPPRELLESAERCLFGAQAAGGDSVKSIEI